MEPNESQVLESRQKFPSCLQTQVFKEDWKAAPYLSPISITKLQVSHFLFVFHRKALAVYSTTVLRDMKFNIQAF